MGLRVTYTLFFKNLIALVSIYHLPPIAIVSRFEKSMLIQSTQRGRNLGGPRLGSMAVRKDAPSHACVGGTRPQRSHMIFSHSLFLNLAHIIIFLFSTATSKHLH